MSNTLKNLNPQHSLRSLADADFARLASFVPTAEIRDKTILLTGATGFFGSWLLSLFDWLYRIKNVPIKILAVSRLPDRFLARHRHFVNAPWLTWIKGDVRDFAFPDMQVDYIIHGATDTSATAGKDPLRLFNTIVQGTNHVLACAKKTAAQRTLLISSGAIYGAQPQNVTHFIETMPASSAPFLAANAYSEGKRAMELLGAIHAQETNTSVVVARCFAFVGGGVPLDGHFAIGNFIRDALGKDQITIRGGGTAERSYLYAADLAIWLVRLLVSGKNGQAYNVGSDQTLTIVELAHHVVDTLSPGKRVSIEGKDDTNGGRNRYIPSIELARTHCGLDVWTDIDRAIVLTAAYRP